MTFVKAMYLVCVQSLSFTSMTHNFALQINLPIPPVTLNKTDKEQITVSECSPNMENPCGDNDVSLTANNLNGFIKLNFVNSNW